MPEPYIQLREIDRRVADFDSREAALEQERKALENRLQSIELVKDLNADKVKALQDELAEVNTRIAAVNGLQREVEGHKAELERQLALLSKKIDAAVAREVAKLGDRSQRVKQLMDTVHSKNAGCENVRFKPDLQAEVSVQPIGVHGRGYYVPPQNVEEFKRDLSDFLKKANLMYSKLLKKHNARKATF